MNGEIYEPVRQKPAWSEEDEKILSDIIKDLVHPWNEYIPDRIEDEIKWLKNWLKSLKERVQPKREWSEEDNIILSRIIADYERSNEEWFNAQNSLPHGRKINWLKSLRPQNNVTDEELAQAKKDAYNDALDKIEYHSGEPTFDDGWSAAIWYLKKRNAQPQSTWKPSDEQMDNLSRAANGVIYRVSLLKELYLDLKKLREE